LRDLAERDLITRDFLLVAGDVVSNLSIEPALARHRARREKDKNAIMTMILREAGLKHRTKPKSCRPVFFIDEKNDRCVHYEEINRKRNGKHYMELDADIMKQHPELDIRGDLLDCHIDICTPDVLGLWSDNFDYQSIRTSFLFGVLKDYELNGKTIHVHVESQGYAARVRSLRAYDAITRDIIDRWTYPLTPDCNVFDGQTYTLGRNKVYQESGVVLARGSKIEQRSIVGKGTSIGDGSTVTNSVLGPRCQIGRNVTIKDSYIWDDVVIDDNTTIDRAIVASEASIARSCTLPAGTLISFGTQISADTKLEPSTTLTRSSSTTKDSSSKPSKPVASAEGEGYDSSSDESDASAHLLSLSPALSFVSEDSISTLRSGSEPDMDDLSLASGAYSDEDIDMLDPTSQRTAQQKDSLPTRLPPSMTA
jgi:translation initiation factor eIF-2B subunit epsilon